MCTLVVASHVLPDRPLVVVANRDEQLDRASSPPFAWKEGFFAPRDDVAGGTWLGVNDHGVFVGITNRYLGGLLHVVQSMPKDARLWLVTLGAQAVDAESVDVAQAPGAATAMRRSTSRPASTTPTAAKHRSRCAP